MSRYWAVVPAAGVGKRMRADRPKQYLMLHGKTVLEHTLERLLSHPRIEGVVVAVAAGDPYWSTLSLADARLRRVEGGAERCHSVLNGLRGLAGWAGDDDWVLVHDAARPCLRHGDIDRLLDAIGGEDCGGLLGVPVSDTLKYCEGESQAVSRTVDRSGLWRALTPQMFRLAPLRAALERFSAEPGRITDEASAMELAGWRPRMVEGRADNIKITRPDDLRLAALYLKQEDQPCA